MAALTVQEIVSGGLEPAYTAANSQDTIKADSSQRHFLHVKNGGGGSINVTINAQRTSARVPGVGVVTISDEVVAVGAGEERMIGPFTEAFMDASGNVVIDYSGTTSVTAAALKLPDAY